MDEPRTWTAKHRFARISARKARLMIDLIRGRRCSDAEVQLRFSPRRSARLIGDVLKSAMVNADEAEADMRALFVTEARVDCSPYLRRWRPKDRGRPHPIAQRTRHLVVTVAHV